MLNIQNLKPGEKIILVIKRHWFVYALMFLGFLGLVFLTTALLLIFGMGDLLNICLIIVWIIFGLLIYLFWLKNELGILIITNKRIIGFEKIDFLKNNLVEFELNEIKQVSTNSKGFFSNILNYGNINIECEQKTLKTKYIPDNIKNAKKILEIIKQNK